MNHYTKYFAILTPYMLIVSTLYLLGYWSVFHINILEFISLSDIIKLAIKQLAYSTAVLIFGIIAGELFLRPLFPLGEGANTPIGKFANRYWKLIMFFTYCYLFYQVFFNNDPQKWRLIAIILGITCSLFLSKTKIFSEIIKNESIRILIIIFIALLPFMSFAWGINDGHATKNNKPKLTVQYSKYNKIEFRYIGFAGDYFFIYNKKNNEIVIVGTKDVEKLKFLIHDKNNKLHSTIKTDTKKKSKKEIGKESRDNKSKERK